MFNTISNFETYTFVAFFQGDKANDYFGSISIVQAKYLKCHLLLIKLKQNFQEKRQSFKIIMESTHNKYSNKNFYKFYNYFSFISRNKRFELLFLNKSTISLKKNTLKIFNPILYHC